MNDYSHHILLIDDDPIILKVLESYLMEEGFCCTLVESGADALALLENQSQEFSAIVLDRMMPTMSGMDVLHKIYISPHLREVPVIMLTSHAERKDVGAAVIVGVFDFLYKPIEKELLLMVIKRAIKKREADKNKN